MDVGWEGVGVNFYDKLNMFEWVSCSLHHHQMLRWRSWECCKRLQPGWSRETQMLSFDLFHIWLIQLSSIDKLRKIYWQLVLVPNRRTTKQNKQTKIEHKRLKIVFPFLQRLSIFPIMPVMFQSLLFIGGLPAHLKSLYDSPLSNLQRSKSFIINLSLIIVFFTPL